MRLKDLERTGTGPKTRYAATLTDDTGARDYELGVSGPRELIEKVFSKSDFDVTISPRVGENDAQERVQAVWKKYGGPLDDLTRVRHLSDLMKKEPSRARLESSVLVALRRTRGEGTFWSLWFPTLFVPRGVNLFFALPPVCQCFGFLVPIGGDPDLFLTLNGISTPTVRASIRAGLAIDSITFGAFPCWPWTQFVPFFRVNGFLASTCGFAWGGVGVP